MKELVESKRYFITEDFSQAFKVGNLLFVSGIIARNAEGKILDDDFESQTIKVFENIQAILDEAEITFEDIVKLTVYLKDIKDLKLFREIRNRYFTIPRPASTAVEVSGLAAGVVVEIEVIAELGRISNQSDLPSQPR